MPEDAPRPPQVALCLGWNRPRRLHIVRRRLDGICAAAGLAIADLDVQVITAPTLRLDLEATLTVEHRTASAMPNITLEAVDRRSQPARATEPSSIDERITAAFADTGHPDLRARCRARTATLYQHLAAMTATGRIVKSADGYHLAPR